MSLASGTRIGPYEVAGPLGAGGMGEVYRATDTKLKRQVAIKILPPSLAADADRLARFQREAEVLASLNHPHIAAIYGLEESAGLTALVIELVEGDDLSQRIARGAIPLDEALPIAKQIAEALEAAHEQGIIHRDLKPANIKVRADGTVKVLDFGLAKALDTTAASALAENSPTITTPAMTQAGMILGTAAYMAPEQARGKPVDKRADIWAFGVVLFEMLTGTRAFDGEDTTEVLGAVVRLEPNYNALPAEVPAPVRTLLQSCLVKEPRLRVADISTALFVLDKAASLAPPVAATAATSVTSVATAAHRGRVAWTVASVAVLGMAAMAVPALRYLRQTPPPAPPVMRVTIEPPDGVTLTSAPMISPDGTHVVFGAGGALYVRPLETLATTRLPATEGAELPFWSPDSTRIGFFADGKLKTIDLAGGAASIVCDAPVGKGGAWSRRGVIVFAPSNTGGLQQVSAAGGTPAPATQLDPATKAISHRWPQFLPDGDHFLYFSLVSPGANGVFVTSLGSTTSTQVVSTDARVAYAPPGALLFLRGTTLMRQPFDTTAFRLTDEPAPVAEDVGTVGASLATLDAAFSVSDTGVLVHSTGQAVLNRRLVWVDRRGGVTPLALAAGAYNSPALSPDGQHIALTVRDATGTHVWAYDIARGTLGKRSFDGRNDFFPIWTRDGTILNFTLATGGLATSVMRLRADGSGPAEPLVTEAQLPGFKVPTSWSPDGRLLALHVGANGVADVTVRDAAGVLHPTLATSAVESEARFAPAGPWFSYHSNETGRGEVYVQSYPLGRGKWQISTDGGAQAMWAQNGKELFYKSGNRIMVVDVALGATFKASTPRVLFEIEMQLLDSTPGQPSRYGVTPDAQRFLVLTTAEGEKGAASTPPITVVLNYAQALKR